MKKIKPELLTYGVIDTPDHPDFDAIYECYSKVFTLESERETKENFEKILASNSDPEVAKGKAKEMWVYLKNEEGHVVAAANFDVFAGSKTPGIDGTIHGIYAFVDPEFRQNGVFKRLAMETKAAASQFIRQTMGDSRHKLNIPVIAEQNSPFLMTAEEYLADNEAAGIDQVVRRVVFEKEGFRTLGCRYIQPPLSEEKGACNYLDMVVKTPSQRAQQFPTSALTEHLDRFFALSFPEGTSRDHPDLAEMNESLKGKKHISIHPMGRWEKLAKHLNAEMVAAIPENKQDLKLSDALPRLKQAFDKDKAIQER